MKYFLLLLLSYFPSACLALDDDSHNFTVGFTPKHDNIDAMNGTGSVHLPPETTRTLSTAPPVTTPPPTTLPSTTEPPIDPGRPIMEAVLQHNSYDHYIGGTIYLGLSRVCNCTTAKCDSGLVKLLGPRAKGLCISRIGICSKSKTLYGDEMITASECQMPHMNEVKRHGGTYEDLAYLHKAEKMFLCTAVRFSRTTCCFESFCNGKLYIEAPDLKLRSDQGGFPWKYILLFFLVIILIVLPLIFCTAACCPQHLPRPLWKLRILNKRFLVPTDDFDGSDGADQLNSPSTMGSLDTGSGSGEYTDTGSGAGDPRLTQRTLAHQIVLSHEIGQGRFGEVWGGTWLGEAIAVKVFQTKDEPAWLRETEMYQTKMLAHANVLHFVASDTKDTGMGIQLWLITQYHPFGSLYDFLNDRTIDMILLLQFLRSISNGLAYLHMEIPGIRPTKSFLAANGNVNNYTPGKPSIAHRDIKSKNILVKNNLVCCIADLGLAVRIENGVLDVPEGDKCGTIRYLAPEILHEDFDVKKFTAYLTSDTYALGLVIWECCMRTNLNDDAYSLTSQEDTTSIYSGSFSFSPRVGNNNPSSLLRNVKTPDTIVEEMSSSDDEMSSDSDSSDSGETLRAVDHRDAIEMKEFVKEMSDPLTESDPLNVSGSEAEVPREDPEERGPPPEPPKKVYFAPTGAYYEFSNIPYQLPYSDMVSRDPSFEEMRKVVLIENKRPPLLQAWYNHPILSNLCRVMSECWHHSATARLTSMNVRMTLDRIIKGRNIHITT